MEEEGGPIEDAEPIMKTTSSRLGRAGTWAAIGSALAAGVLLGGGALDWKCAFAFEEQ